MLCYLERRKASQAYPLSAVKLVNALLHREERSHPGKNGGEPDLVPLPVCSAIILRRREAIQVKSEASQYLSLCQFAVL
jgi:hypothetical protein